MAQKLTIRPAGAEDVGVVLGFIRALASYEKMEDKVVATEEGLREAMFGRGRAQALIAEEDGAPVGFAPVSYTHLDMRKT